MIQLFRHSLFYYQFYHQHELLYANISSFPPTLSLLLTRHKFIMYWLLNKMKSIIIKIDKNSQFVIIIKYNNDANKVIEILLNWLVMVKAYQLFSLMELGGLLDNFSIKFSVLLLGWQCNGAMKFGGVQELYGQNNLVA